MADANAARFPVYVVGWAGRKPNTYIDYYRTMLGEDRHCLFFFSSLETVRLFFASHPRLCDGSWTGVPVDTDGMSRVLDFVEAEHAPLDCVALDIALPPSGFPIETVPIAEFRAGLKRG